jgi:hypothetical protein
LIPLRPATYSAAPLAADQPLPFVQNVGQLPPGVRFGLLGGALLVADVALWLNLPAPEQPGDQPEARQGVHLKLSFVGAARPHIEPFDRLPATLNYFRGADPAGWRANLPVWGGVRLTELYPHIDLELRGTNGRLAPRLVARPGADPGAVRLRVEGAETLALAGDTLRLTTAAGPFALPLFRFTSSDSAVRLPAAQPELHGQEVAAPLAAAPVGADAPAPADSTHLRYSTLLGITGTNEGDSITVDASGQAYISGYTNSDLFPTTPGAYIHDSTGIDVIVAKWSANGQQLLYATVIGGSGIDYADNIALGPDGSIFLAGNTASADFPTTSGAFDRATSGINSATRESYLLKLSPAGDQLS